MRNNNLHLKYVACFTFYWMIFILMSARQFQRNVFLWVKNKPKLNAKFR